MCKVMRTWFSWLLILHISSPLCDHLIVSCPVMVSLLLYFSVRWDIQPYLRSWIILPFHITVTSQDLLVVCMQKSHMCWSLSSWAAGGVIGFLKSGSSKSLLAGGGSAFILYYVYLNLSVNPAFSSAIGLGMAPHSHHLFRLKFLVCLWAYSRLDYLEVVKHESEMMQ
jgi:hypothetical protein